MPDLPAERQHMLYIHRAFKATWPRRRVQRYLGAPYYLVHVGDGVVSLPPEGSGSYRDAVLLARVDGELAIGGTRGTECFVVNFGIWSRASPNLGAGPREARMADLFAAAGFPLVVPDHLRALAAGVIGAVRTTYWDGPAGYLSSCSLLLDLLARLHRPREGDGVAPDDLRERLRAEIRRRRRTMSVAEMAAFVGLSRDHLTRCFRARYGQTARDFKHEERWALAQRYLREGREPIRLIATYLGFRSTSAFSQAFRRYCGLSPSAYRRQGAV